MGGLCGALGRNGDLDLIGSGPYFLLPVELKTVHRDLYPWTLIFQEQVVIIDFLALEWVIRSALDGIRVRASATSHKISDAAMFVPLVVVYMPGEDHDAIRGVGLACFQHGSEILLT